MLNLMAGYDVSSRLPIKLLPGRTLASTKHSHHSDNGNQTSNAPPAALLTGPGLKSTGGPLIRHLLAGPKEGRS